MTGHRQAAVALHALADADRGLILEQLAPADQSLLRGYLDELTALGFEPDRSTPPPAPGAPGAPSRQAGLASASATAMFGLLEHEPVALVAEVLALQPWSWSAGLLALYHPARREAIAAVQTAPAPARALFVLESLTARLAQAAVPAAAPAPSSPFETLWRRVTSWRP
ncbi:hypothetical protein [Duganella sp. HH101]|uniref:hypothetical protein n=1 Tax=Duganella sp. HH101 TaxID=1781066 RepID=UPI0008752C94|nr:hypothetical protein [Duganella sp. HH101]OEZ96675.1 hypothetical protein DUGA2_62890 [Duganella sp. HH101]